jgi:hypothetical protein
MKARIAQMEKDIRGIHAMAAVIKKKGELATDAERYALTELHRATESLNCKYPNFMFLNFCNNKDTLLA